MKHRSFLTLCSLLLAGSLFSAASHADQTARPVVSIIIDDMGYHLKRGIDAINLPGPITYAFLPHLEHSQRLATLAYLSHKEVMLHLPMEAINSKHTQRFDPGALTLEMDQQQFIETLRHNLDAIPHISGINNHMGSLMTQHPSQMRWLMHEISDLDDLYFVDSYTTNASIAQQAAIETGIPSTRRDVFLDDDTNIEAIRYQFQRLIKKALNEGTALAIAHPHSNTLKVLRQELPKLEEHGISLISVKDLIQLRNNRSQLWQASLSLSPKAVKN